MPVNEGTVSEFLKLGTVGAVLLILLIFMLLLFSNFYKMMKNQTENLKDIINTMEKISGRDTEQNGNKMDKLCDKIDLLVQSLAEERKEAAKNQVANDKDQQEIIKMLVMINTGMLDVQRRIVRVDDRTFTCLGNIKKASEEAAAEKEVNP